MTFWDEVHQIVGFIPNVGTLKDVIEAGIGEAKGHDAAARKIVIKAGLDLLSDIITVATLGTAAAVATAGKIAAEEALKQVENGALETATKAKELGLGKEASKLVTAATYASTQKQKVSRTTKYKAKERKERKKPEPKQGHHVINKGVLKLFREIIKIFVDKHGEIFFGKSYATLVEEGFINPRGTPALKSSHDQPLPQDVSRDIREMTADTPEGETHDDPNDKRFGISKLALCNALTHVVLDVFYSLRDTGIMPNLEGGFGARMAGFNDLIRFITQEPTGQDGIYVDIQVKGWWLNEGGQMAKFTRCRDSVRDMYKSLADLRRPPKERIACIWGREIYHIYTRLQERYSRPPGQLPSVIYNPIDYVKNSGQPPERAIKLGFQNDGVGELYSAVAMTRWGTIPGKAKGDTCWFPYNEEEHTTKNFVWLTAMRPVEMKQNEGYPPPLAIQCAFQKNGVGYLYAAIAQTIWGKIPGNAKDSTCWYTYGGRVHSTRDFYWLVRGTPGREDFSLS